MHFNASMYSRTNLKEIIMNLEQKQGHQLNFQLRNPAIKNVFNCRQPVNLDRLSRDISSSFARVNIQNIMIYFKSYSDSFKPGGKNADFGHHTSP